MTQDTTGRFEDLYQGESALGGFLLDMVPWDIGEPQPVVVALEDAGLIAGAVLDAGCGPGDNALFLAGRGHRVTGFDAAPSAVQQASERASERGLDVEFAVADATSLQGWGQRFTTVIDSGLYHCLSGHEREEYVATLHRVCRTGARLHLLCVSDAAPTGIPVPYRISQGNLRRTLAGWWKIVGLRSATFATALTPPYLCRLVERGRMAPVDVEGLTLDDKGRILLPIWQVEAERI